ncbi:Cytochrome o ubiquinol oxidase protein CyoD [Piscirickettsia salmonis]|uniref:cytochrome o ubiquinol oxidase subunit IV n=1 Tax=Piscirickettsia salmonis TaxID=1238 RepID=UPI0012BB1912|nr:cytochrome o ubiquinol oxidase subunit IV [Piscirickettsia salmonis]QGP54611.1 Cytochrome o ubiquinol oxidase protein CyoD [Piscirickettsia salmonis]QGP59492.1 Cytochrome o ubiquinol oxidase protein CyoD [Piscirickettsia salmonis]QGP64189.1 Cytochrome o ubiquinol oxidase protein CyoD [Piscirickettsia salmonis]
MSESHHPQDIANEKHGYTLKSYIVGFILSLGITFIAFALVAYKMLPSTGLYIAVAILAIIQLFVQLKFFLHMTTNPSGRWDLVSFIFTIFVVLILVGGTLWIMYDLDYNMVH